MPGEVPYIRNRCYVRGNSLPHGSEELTGMFIVFKVGVRGLNWTGV